MEWIFNLLRHSPELAIFLTLALGFALGQVKVKKFGLGTVTSVLIVGVVVGQLGIEISPVVKSAFFLLFLFAIGYSVGPQFVHGLKKEGLPQILFATIVCVIILGVSWGMALLFGFDVGNSAGLLAGANTISAVIGVASDTIGQLAIDAAEKEKYINAIPVAYAVTYIFGTAGTAWFLSSLGPRILGGDIVKLSKEYEEQHGGLIEDDPTLENAYSGATFRVVEVTSGFFDDPKTVGDVENVFLTKGWPVYIERIRIKNGDIVQYPGNDQIISKGDRIVLNGPVESVVGDESLIGREVADLELLDFRVEVLKVMVTNKKAAGLSLGKLKKMKERHGVIIRRIYRSNVQVPLLRNVKLNRGDVVEIEGRKCDVDSFADFLGQAERQTNVTDLLYVALGIFLGGILGSLTLRLGNVPLSLSVSGGVLVLGIIFGWFHSRHPKTGAVPQPAIWLMNNLGLNAFIAVVGITAGPSFIEGLKASGVNLFIAGIFASILPMFFGLLIGKYIFKFHPAINLGANAGARTTTAALGAIEEATKSHVPSLSYTTTYAIGNTLLIIWGVVIVLLMS